MRRTMGGWVARASALCGDGESFKASDGYLKVRSMLGIYMAYYLSFCDTNRPTGQQFIGACIVPIGDNSLDGLEIAIRFAWKMGCNPGGEVKSVFMGDELQKRFERFSNRLMSKAQIDEMDAQMVSERN